MFEWIAPTSSSAPLQTKISGQGFRGVPLTARLHPLRGQAEAVTPTFLLQCMSLLLARSGSSLRRNDMSAIEGGPDSQRTWLRGAFLTRTFARCTPLLKRIVLGWSRSHYRSEQGPDASRQPHGQCTPDRDAYCAHRHARASRARGQRSQK